MNLVFELEDYEFSATMEDMDFGEEFTAYYDQCQPLQYDADNLPDFVYVEWLYVLPLYAT